MLRFELPADNNDSDLDENLDLGLDADEETQLDKLAILQALLNGDENSKFILFLSLLDMLEDIELLDREQNDKSLTADVGEFDLDTSLFETSKAREQTREKMKPVLAELHSLFARRANGVQNVSVEKTLETPRPR